MKLEIEMLPRYLWGKSLCNFLRKNNREIDWEDIKDTLLSKEGDICWICGGVDSKLDAHEVWEYITEDSYSIVRIQKLVAIHLLCDICHKTKHIDFWCYNKYDEDRLKREGLTEEDLIEHFCKVNECKRKVFNKHLKKAFVKFKEREGYIWKQDLSEYKRYILRKDDYEALLAYFSEYKSSNNFG